MLQGILRDKHGVKKRLVVIQCRTGLLCEQKTREKNYTGTAGSGALLESFKRRN